MSSFCPVGFFKEVVQGVVQDAQKLLTCGPKDIGQLIGENASPAVFLKVLGKLADSAKLSKYADDLLKKEADSNGNNNSGNNNSGNDNNGDGDNSNGNSDTDGATCWKKTSFPAGTLVATPNGDIAIENIRIGMEVYTRNDKGFINGTAKVLDTFNRIAPAYYLISTEYSTVKATEEHLFWMQGRGWVAAKDMQPWYMVAGVEDDVLIKAVKRVDEEIKVYNFEVEGSHTYFVGEGGLWVHNDSSCKDGYSIEHAEQLLKAAYPEVWENYTIYKDTNGVIIIRRHKEEGFDKLRFDGEKIIVDNDIIPEANKAKKKPKTTSSPNDYRNIEIEVNGSKKTAGELYDVYEAARMTARKNYDEAKASGDRTKENEALTEMKQISQKLGELSSEAWVKNKYPNAKALQDKLPGAGEQGQFDKIFVDADSGKLIIIEAKGGASQLGSRMVTRDKDGNEIKPPARYQQGSKEYMEDVIWKYKKTYADAKDKKISMSESELNALRETIEAFEGVDAGMLDIEYQVVRQTVNSKDGSLGNVESQEFEI